MRSSEQEVKHGFKFFRIAGERYTLRERGGEVMFSFRSVMFKVTTEYSAEMSSSACRERTEIIITS